MNEEKVYMKGYKAFKNGLVCDPTGEKPFQFFENTVFEEPEEVHPRGRKDSHGHPARGPARNR